MEYPYVTVRFQNNSLESLRSLIQFLEKAEQILKTDEDSQLCFVCEPEVAQLKVGMAKLVPTMQFDPKGSYQVVAGEYLVFFGSLDLYSSERGFRTLFPPPAEGSDHSK